MGDDEQMRRDRAKRLREEIDALKRAGQERPPASPREFIEQETQRRGKPEESERKPDHDQD